MAALALTSVAVGLAASQLAEPELLVGIEWALTIVFAIEYALRLWAAPSRMAYFKGAILDLVSILPPVRGARLLRLLRLLRVASDLNSAIGTTRLGGQALMIVRIAIVWIAVVVISALGMYLAESGQNPNVHSIWDALWWAVVTITTVGYGDVSPATTEGRLAAAVLMVLGIAFFSFLTATFTAALTTKKEESPEAKVVEKIKQLNNLRIAGHLSASEYKALRKKTINEI